MKWTKSLALEMLRQPLGDEWTLWWTDLMITNHQNPNVPIKSYQLVALYG